MGKWKWVLLTLAILGAIYFSGPGPSSPLYSKAIPTIPDINELDSFVARQEAVHHLKKDNQARIIWADDSVRQQTDYSIVYLHGFSASQEEGNPVHRNIARYFNCNLFLSRLSEHGIDTSDAFVNLTPHNYWESAKQALFIGKKLGKKVILMGTSTGGTQALQLAAAFPDDVAALILYSPNIAINDPFAFLLNDPWGLQIARKVKGGLYNYPADTRPIYSAYWNRPYRLESVVSLQEMLETTMNEKTFAAVKQPVLLLYYYKDKEHQDNVVRVDAMLNMFSHLGTAADMKVEKALPNTGNHVIGSPILSKDILSVETETRKFLLEKLHLQPPGEITQPHHQE